MHAIEPDARLIYGSPKASNINTIEDADAPDDEREHADRSGDARP